MRLRALPVLLLAVVLAGCAANMAPVYSRGGRAPTSYYVVRTGDTLYSISWRHGVDYRAVARWNRIDPPYTIYPGQRLRLQAGPGGRQPVQTAASSSSTPPKRRTTKADWPPRPPEPKVPTRTSTVTDNIAWRWPTDGRLARPFSADAHGKQGIELAGAVGQPIMASAAGRVVYAGSGLRGYGNLVIVKHNGRYLTAYGYNQTILVREGDAVQAGQRIATMGIGPNSQPALHFELRRDGKPVDPSSYLADK